MQFDFPAERLGELLESTICMLRGLVLPVWFSRCHCYTSFGDIFQGLCDWGTASRP
jgi:hypothetical protein